MHAFPQAELIAQCNDVGFQLSLTDCHHPRGHTAFVEFGGGAQQVRIVLLVAIVGDRADHQLAFADPEFLPYGSPLAGPCRGAGDIDPVLQGDASGCGPTVHAAPGLLADGVHGIIESGGHSDSPTGSAWRTCPRRCARW